MKQLIRINYKQPVIAGGPWFGAGFLSIDREE
jgi:hypothetical protein